MGIKSLIRLYQAKEKAPIRIPPKITLPRYNREACVVVNNSFCDLLGVPAKALEEVRAALTYKNEQVEQERLNAFRLLSMGKRRQNRKMIGLAMKKLKALDGQDWVCWFNENRFPTGLLNIVKDVLHENDVDVQIDDKRRVPTPVNAFRWAKMPAPLRYYQEDMVRLALEHSRGVFESAVGSGKTRVLTEIIKILEVNSLIVAPSSALLEQTYNTLKTAFGNRNVMILSTGHVTRHKKLKPIVVATIHTLAALQKKDFIDEALKDFDLLAVDEIHHAGSKSYTNLLPKIEHIYYRFGFTGTFLRNDCKTLDMWGFLSNCLYSYPAWKATQEGFLTPVEFHIHTLPGVSKRAYPSEYKINYCENPILLDEIESIINSTDQEKQVLVLVDRKDTAGLVIHEFLEEQGIENVYISGDDTKEHIFECISQFNEKKIRVLIGSTVIGEGIDLYSTDHLVLARGGKSEIAIVQAIGRAVRLAEKKIKAFVHDFRFKNTKYMERHLEKRLKIYKESFGGEIIAA